MRTRGRTSHCETEPRAGHRKAVNGKVGVRTRASELVNPSLFFFNLLRLGLCAEPGAPAIVTVVVRLDSGTFGGKGETGAERTKPGMCFVSLL